MELPSTRALLSETFLFLRTHAKTIYLAAGIPIAIAIVGNVIAGFLDPTNPIHIALGFIAALAAFVAFLIVIIQFTQATNDFLDGKRVVLLPTVTLTLMTFAVTILTALALFGGFVLFFVPGVIWSVWYALTMEAVILDRTGIRDSFRTSHTLVRGIFWKAAVRLAALSIVFMLIPILLVMALIAGVFPEVFQDPTTPLAMTPANVFWSFVINILEVAIQLPLAASWVILYRHLKTRRAALDIRPMLDASPPDTFAPTPGVFMQRPDIKD